MTALSPTLPQLNYQWITKTPRWKTRKIIRFFNELAKKTQTVFIDPQPYTRISLGKATKRKLVVLHIEVRGYRFTSILNRFFYLKIQVLFYGRSLTLPEDIQDNTLQNMLDFINASEVLRKITLRKHNDQRASTTRK